MTWHAPALTPAHGAYALIALAVAYGLAWILAKLLFYRDQPSPDPEDDIHGDVPHVARASLKDQRHG